MKLGVQLTIALRVPIDLGDVHTSVDEAVRVAKKMKALEEEINKPK